MLKVILKMEAPNPIENAIKWSNSQVDITKDKVTSKIIAESTDFVFRKVNH